MHRTVNIRMVNIRRMVRTLLTVWRRTMPLVDMRNMVHTEPSYRLTVLMGLPLVQNIGLQIRRTTQRRSDIIRLVMAKRLESPISRGVMESTSIGVSIGLSSVLRKVTMAPLDPLRKKEALGTGMRATQIAITDRG
ncbi:hypothetical protein [Pseudobacteriovorax antillogorgiicola]|uniref:hypothetical protein n=1 Tax=Pseudobacteriovorax antillogorgiicola TaxID=1513793 RepID=UPI00117B05F3|nr:hypothetical protein [Pseudobacteriovorax antillogorgiicola]